LAAGIQTRSLLRRHPIPDRIHEVTHLLSHRVAGGIQLKHQSFKCEIEVEVFQNGHSWRHDGLVAVMALS
jgi:hypothetical protein